MIRYIEQHYEDEDGTVHEAELRVEIVRTEGDRFTPSDTEVTPLQLVIDGEPASLRVHGALVNEMLKQPID